jgi:hypothetical protein
MEYAVEMRSGAIICIPSFIKIVYLGVYIIVNKRRSLGRYSSLADSRPWRGGGEKNIIVND